MRLPRPALLLLLLLRVPGTSEPSLATCEPPLAEAPPEREPERVSWRPRLLPAPTTEESDCAGAIVLLDEEGEAYDTVRFTLNDTHWLSTDAEGRAEWLERPCGEQSVTIRMDDTRFEFDDVRIENDSDLVLVWPSEDFAVVRLVGPDCQPWTVLPARPVTVSSIEELGEGRLRLWSVEAEVRLMLRVGGADVFFDVPIDGEEHRIAVPKPRTVEVEALCPPDGCGALWCSWDPSTDVEDGLATCPCPPDGASLRSTGAPGPNRPIPDGATRIRVDLRPEGNFSDELLEEPWPVLAWGPPVHTCESDDEAAATEEPTSADRDTGAAAAGDRSP